MGEGAVKKYENHFLRIFVAVVVMFVTFVHYNPDFNLFGYHVVDVVYGIGRFAMPVFFMISGYFLFSEDGHCERNIKRKIIHLILLIIVMKLAYFIVDLFRLGAGLIDGNKLLIGLIADPNYGVHEWFVYALLIMYVVWWGFRKYKINTKHLLWIGAIFLILDLVIGEFLPIFGVYDLGGVTTTVAIGEILYPFIAVFSFTIGYYLHEYKSKTDSYSTSSLLIWMFVGIILMTAETFIVLNTGIYEGANTGHPGPNMYIGSIITMITVFILSFRIPENVFRCRILEFMGRSLLPWMYAFMFIGTCMIKEFQWFDPNDYIMYNVVGLILAILIDIILAYLVYLLLKWIASYVTKKKGAKSVKA